MARELTAAHPAPGSQRALVLDTNIVLDLLVFSDPATAPLQGFLASGTLRWIATAGMRAELARVLHYPQIAPRLERYAITAQAVLAQFDASAHIAEPAPPVTAVCLDPDDQPFVDLAAAHSAILLSKDRAVLQLRTRLATHGAVVARSMAAAASGSAVSGMSMMSKLAHPDRSTVSPATCLVAAVMPPAVASALNFTITEPRR